MKLAAGTGAALAMPSMGNAAVSPREKMIGIQIGAISFVDEGTEQVQERDLYGRHQETLCVNNPNYRNFFSGLVEDFARSYDVDGIMWGSERQGALCDSLGATHDTPPIAPGEVTCFCEFCCKKA